MSPGFSFSLALVECELRTKMTWQQKPELISKAICSCLHSRGTHMGSASSIGSPWCQNQQHVSYHPDSSVAPPGLLSARDKSIWKAIVVHAENCSIHRSAAIKSFMQTRDMVLMPHPLYSLDLAPSDFFYFPLSKKGSNMLLSLTKISYSKSSTQFWGRFLGKTWNGSLKFGESALRMSTQAMEATFTNKQFSNKCVYRSAAQETRACTYSPNDSASLWTDSDHNHFLD
jgi:hypothetical protein